MTSQEQAPLAQKAQESQRCQGMQEQQQRLHEEFEVNAENKFVQIYWAFLRNYTPTVAEQAVIVQCYGVSRLEELITQQYKREVINHWLGEHLKTHKIRGQGGFMQAKKRRIETWLNGKLCKFLAASPKLPNCKESKVCVCVVRAHDNGSIIKTSTKIDKQQYDQLVYTYEFLPCEQDWLIKANSAMFSQFEQIRTNQSGVDSNTPVPLLLVVKKNLLEILDICYLQTPPPRVGTVAAGWDEVRNLFLVEQTKVQGEKFEQIFYSQLLTEVRDDQETCTLHVINSLDSREEMLQKQDRKALALSQHRHIEGLYR